MQFMEADRQVCDKLLPGLRQQLTEIPLPELESEDSPAIEIFRAHGGTNLLVPGAFGGLDASPLDAARVVRALAATAPSMTVATMMHHFSLGTLFAVAELVRDGSDVDELLLRRVVDEKLLVASGFAEGRTAQGILSPTMAATPVDGGYLVNGAKKPCSLSASMDLLTASVAVPRPDGSSAMGLLLLPADTPGISVHPFWSTFALAGAESNEVRLSDVLVSPEQIIAPEPELADAMDRLTTVGLIWFQLTVCAAYTGIASLLVEKVLHGARGGVSERAALAVRIESAAALTEGLARRMMDGETDNDTLAAALVTRYAVQDAVTATVGQAVELLGGMAFIATGDVAYLASAAQAIAFHPPSRTSAAGGLLDYYAGYPMVVA
ncbi:acyl-CoA dehydrogenase family protein [Actinophytocola gossypii]|uniref:Acyl-CoA/acyl-ACP dehydrogenase n=1 Tax=Actinophytocola gossypii TaxID=2812003 RepID=A0ABT2J4M3_9PSEU|nr:acyl-CoA dehydrogenase family protein [Actinophytocola gossypii]MCT2582797.1 acyl-CoA/acyl-ACP dehydrogenase [Actinophytocola gossypii]